MKRRTFLAGLAGGSIIAASGISYRQWTRRFDIQQQPLMEFNSSVSFDVCIVGTGPAGCILAENMSDSGYQVLLLESGVSMSDYEGMEKTLELDSYSSSGVLNYPLEASRMRALGGTSNIWTGRCPRMLPSDFTDNPLAPGGRWPFSYAELQPYYRRAEKSLHVVGDKLSASQAPREKDLPRLFLPDIGGLKTMLNPLGISIDFPPLSEKMRFFEDFGPIRFASDMLPALSHRSNVQLLTGTTATRVLTNSNGQVTGIQVRSQDGVIKEVKAKHYVVACGAVESTRLLLLSKNEHFPNGIGNHSDYLGRYFMEHPFVSYTAQIPEMEPFKNGAFGRTYQYSQKLRQQGLGGIVVAFYIKSNEQKSLTIKLGIEMFPNADNRILLNPDNIDPYGNPGANLQIAFSPQDQILFKRGEEIIYDIYKQLNSTDISKSKSLHWSHHHMGTTRMSVAASDGVVDPNLRVHGTDNLHILSSSVFITSGVANPTLTITALTHRLSDHLQTVL